MGRQTVAIGKPDAKMSDFAGKPSRPSGDPVGTEREPSSDRSVSVPRPPLSHRSSTLIGGVIAILVLRWYTSGKLKKAGAAWSGSGSGSGSPGTAGYNTNVEAGSGPEDTGKGWNDPTPGWGIAGHPDPSSFGLGKGSFHDAVKEAPWIIPYDTAGLKAFGGGPVAHDWDYGTAIGSKVRAPIDAVYLGDDSGPWGHAAVLDSPVTDSVGRVRHRLVELMHLGSISLTKGQKVKAGQLVGTTGGPYPAQYWSGPHLAVIVDQGGMEALGG